MAHLLLHGTRTHCPHTFISTKNKDIDNSPEEKTNKLVIITSIYVHKLHVKVWSEFLRMLATSTLNKEISTWQTSWCETGCGLRVKMPDCALGVVSVDSDRRSADTGGLAWERVPGIMAATWAPLSESDAGWTRMPVLYFTIPQFEVWWTRLGHPS